MNLNEKWKKHHLKFLIVSKLNLKKNWTTLPCIIISKNYRLNKRHSYESSVKKNVKIFFKKSYSKLIVQTNFLKLHPNSNFWNEKKIQLILNIPNPYLFFHVFKHKKRYFENLNFFTFFGRWWKNKGFLFGFEVTRWVIFILLLKNESPKPCSMW
jgi:hypothetical protein